MSVGSAKWPPVGLGLVPLCVSPTPSAAEAILGVCGTGPKMPNRFIRFERTVADVALHGLLMVPNFFPKFTIQRWPQWRRSGAAIMSTKLNFWLSPGPGFELRALGTHPAVRAPQVK